MASGLFHLDMPVAQLAQAGFVAALAVHETLTHFAPNMEFRLKWPNDVLVDGGKICGILPETGLGANGYWLVLGIGINLAHAPQLPDRKTCALSQVLHPGATLPSPRQVLDVLVIKMHDWLARWREEGFVPVRTAWLQQAHGLGRTIAVSGNGTGIFADMDESGALILRQADGTTRRVNAGEIFFD